jgi:hypothetical protein
MLQGMILLDSASQEYLLRYLDNGIDGEHHYNPS